MQQQMRRKNIIWTMVLSTSALHSIRYPVKVICANSNALIQNDHEIHWSLRSLHILKLILIYGVNGLQAAFFSFFISRCQYICMWSQIGRHSTFFVTFNKNLKIFAKGHIQDHALSTFRMVLFIYPQWNVDSLKLIFDRHLVSMHFWMA